jgi:hypothetical protein
MLDSTVPEAPAVLPVKPRRRVMPYRVYRLAFLN